MKKLLPLLALPLAYKALDRVVPRAESGIMLNDADCGFCMRTARLVRLAGARVDASTVQAVPLDRFNVDPDRAVTEMPYVHADGRVEYGHRAFRAVLRTGPLWARLISYAMYAPPVDALARRVYAWVAANRSRLPGGTPSCSL